MCLKSPRISRGASGLGSQMSRCEGPPWRKIRMTLLAFPQPDLLLPLGASLPRACDSSWSSCARLRPKSPQPPTRSNSRRENPSHVLPEIPGIDSMFQLRSFLPTVCRLSVVEKRRTVQERPGDILRRLQPLLGLIAQHNPLQLLLRGRPIEDRVVQLLDHLSVLFIRFDDLLDPAAVGHRIADRRAVHQIDCMRKGEITRALTFAG